MLAMIQKRTKEKQMFCLNELKTKTHEIEQMNKYSISKMCAPEIRTVIFSQTLLTNMG